MRKLLPTLAAFAFLSTAALAETKTLTGEAVCAKCALKETADCQNTLTLEENGKKVTYYLEGDESKNAHGKLGICGAKKEAPVKIKVTGDTGEKDGKKTIMVSKIEKAD